MIFNNNVFLIVWFTDSLFSEDYLAFRFGSQRYTLHLRSVAMGFPSSPLGGFHEGGGFRGNSAQMRFPPWSQNCNVDSPSMK